MNDAQTKPTQILLVISLAILALVAAGWLLLDSGGMDAPALRETPANEAPLAGDMPAEGDSGQPEPTQVEADGAAALPADAAGSAAADEVPDPVATVETNLRMARIAAQADMLVEPPDQSAVHFYHRALSIEPDHAVARAELDAVLGRLASRVAAILESGDYEQAYDIARRVVGVAPDHSIVRDVQQTLEQLANERITEAMAAAELGDEEGARELLAQAAALPGRNPEYLEAVSGSISDLTAAYSAAQAEQAELALQVAVQAREEWAQNVRSAIADGRLIAPDVDNARSMLAADTADDETTEELWQAWLEAVLEAAADYLEAGELDVADTLVAAAEDSEMRADDVASIRSQVEAAYLAREAERVVPVAELTAINVEPAVFPARAELRGISGYVRVEFTVDTDGTTGDISIVEAEPETLFNESALAAVSAWTFEPREFRGQAIPQRASARLVFRLN